MSRLSSDSVGSTYCEVSGNVTEISYVAEVFEVVSFYWCAGMAHS